MTRGASRLWQALAVAALVVGSVAEVASAGAVLLSGAEVRFRHARGTVGAGTVVYDTGWFAPAGSYVVDGNIDVNGAGSSTAFGGVEFRSSATSFGVALANGSGVVQDNPQPEDPYGGDPSAWRIDYNAIWEITDSSFGPALGRLGPMVATGTVGGGGEAKYSGSMNWIDPDTSGTYRPTANTYVRVTDPGPFEVTVSDASLLVPTSLPVGAKIQISGHMTFSATNHDEPTEFFVANCMNAIQEGGVECFYYMFTTQDELPPPGGDDAYRDMFFGCAGEHFGVDDAPFGGVAVPAPSAAWAGLVLLGGIAGACRVRGTNARPHAK